tara:strand:+ start:734 stop:1606 length:873 start_codon:yes stop_codon:yes gene_type:complete
MDYQLKELKGLREELDRVIEEKKNKVRTLCYKLNEECDKEVKDFFHKTFNGKYEWDGYKVWITGEENPFADFRVAWETDWDSPTYDRFVKFELESYGFRRIDPTNCENAESIMRHHRSVEELFFMMSEGHLDKIKEIENTYRDIIDETKKHHQTKGGLEQLKDKEREVCKKYADRLNELFVEGFEFNVKGIYKKYYKQYENEIRLAGDYHYDICRIRIDKVTPKQMVYTLIRENKRWDDNKEQYVPTGECTEFQYRKTKSNIEQELKTLYQNYFIDFKALHLKELEEKES